MHIGQPSLEIDDNRGRAEAVSGAAAPSVPQGGLGGGPRHDERHRVIVNVVAGFVRLIQMPYINWE